MDTGGILLIFVVSLYVSEVTVEATCDVKQTGLHSHYAVRQYHVNLRNYTSHVMSMPGLNRPNFEIGNAAFSAYGITEIFNALYRESTGSLRRQLESHHFLRFLSFNFFRRICGIIRENVLGSFCLNRNRAPDSNVISFTELYLRRLNQPEWETSEEILNWEVITSGRRTTEDGFASPMDRMLSQRSIMGVNDLLRHFTDGEEESLVAINVVNFRGLWKFSATESEERIKFRLSAKKTNKHFQMLDGVASTGVFRYLLCEENGVYTCHRRGMPNIYEIRLTASSGQDFRMMIYQTTQNLTIESIQDQFRKEGTKKWKLGKSSFLLQPAQLILPKINITTCYDLINHMVKKDTDTHFMREYLDIYGSSDVIPVTYKATKLLALTQFSITDRGISPGNSPPVNRRPSPPPVSEGDQVRLKVDSPFMFAIEHEATGTLVLAGRVLGNS